MDIGACELVLLRELLFEPGHIRDGPVRGEHSVFDAINPDRGKYDGLAGRLNAEDLSGLSTVEPHLRDNEIALGDLLHELDPLI